MSDLGKLLRTARYLRPEQLAARAAFMAEQRLLQRSPRILARRYQGKLAGVEARLVDAPPLWSWPPAAFDPAARADETAALDAARGTFTFLNQRHELGLPPDWSTPGTQRLWRVQLHGFAYAVDLAVSARNGQPGSGEALRGLVEDWLRVHSGTVGVGDPWHPFVASERQIHWAVARSLLAAGRGADSQLQELLRVSLLVHALYLDEHLEVDVGGNHLLKNGVALLVAGCAFEGPAADRWRRRAAALLEQEMARQVLADGGHYERSPMYHLLVLRDLLIALHVAGRRELPVSAALADAVRRMQRYARTLVHPDGEIPLFNDAVLGEAPRPTELVGPSTQAADAGLVDSGYFLLPSSTESTTGVLIADCGAPGPDDLPAHVHADALSFELSVGERRVLVDGGMLNYEPGADRQWLRGTAAHNTVELDGLDQSEVWATFRVGRRARVALEEWRESVPAFGPGGRGSTGSPRTDQQGVGFVLRPVLSPSKGSSKDERDGFRVPPSREGELLVGSHDGYARLGAIHRREIWAVPGAGWRVLDTLVGEGGEHEAVSRLRLHPTLRWQRAGDAWEALDTDGQCLLRVLPIGQPDASKDRGLYAERFNRPSEVSVLCLRRKGPLPLLFGYWLLLPGGRPVVA